jgi:hypothetical protein
MPTGEFEDVLRFWFPSHLSGEHAVMVRQFEWWFGGGADAGRIPQARASGPTREV